MWPGSFEEVELGSSNLLPVERKIMPVKYKNNPNEVFNVVYIPWLDCLEMDNPYLIDEVKVKK